MVKNIFIKKNILAESENSENKVNSEINDLEKSVIKKKENIKDLKVKIIFFINFFKKFRKKNLQILQILLIKNILKKIYLI